MTKTILPSLHRDNAHLSANHWVAKSRERFWVPKVRSIANSIVKDFWECKRLYRGAYRLPVMLPLPAVRVADVAPFLYTGLDYFGPIQVLAEVPGLLPAHLSMVTTKGYVALFTCLVTRAVHLEYANDLTRGEFLQCLLRFSSLRRTPKFIVSDNGSNFTFIEKLIGKTVRIHDTQVREFIQNKNIAWYLILAYTPWYAGVYESMVGIVKSCLERCLQGRVLSVERMRTVLYQVMDIVNSQPLTYLPAGEVVELITPNHFLRLGGEHTNTFLESNISEVPIVSSADKLLAGYKEIERAVREFRITFFQQYFALLKEKHILSPMHRHPRGSYPYKPQVSDVVLIQ